MSVFPLEADIPPRPGNVGFGPIPEVGKLVSLNGGVLSRLYQHGTLQSMRSNDKARGYLRPRKPHIRAVGFEQSGIDM
jgi:hypothetical protein